jgi:hypothetical protein
MLAYYPLVENMYDQVHSQGQWGRIWSKLTGRSRRLLSLAEVKTCCAVRTRAAAGMQTVSIKQIRGSESRSRDFDRDFNPLRHSSRARWLSIALARQQDKPLPAVQLIQVGDIYFVRDGHHRISVARALGQLHIDAEVIMWQVNGPLPWDKPALAPAPVAAQPQIKHEPKPRPQFQVTSPLTIQPVSSSKCC